MRTGKKMFTSAFTLVLLMILQTMLVFAPTVSATNPLICGIIDFDGTPGECDDWRRGADLTPNSQTWVKSQYDFKMVDTSQVQLEMVWAIHEFERSSLGSTLNGLDLGTDIDGQSPNSARDGIPADFIRNYIGERPEGGATPTVGDMLLSQAESVITDMLNSGFGAETQANAEFTTDATVGGSPIACENDPTKDASGTEGATQANSYYPALCLKVEATVNLDSSAVAINSTADIERTYRGLMIMGAEISTPFTLQSPAGHESNYKIMPPDYAQIVEVEPAAAVIDAGSASWAINSRSLVEGAPDQSLDVSIKMKHKSNASTESVDIDTSSDKGVDIQITLDMRDESAAKLEVEVGIYYIDAATMSSWGINLVDISNDATMPWVTADGIRLAKHNGLIDDNLLKNSFPTNALASGVNAMLEGDPVTMKEISIEGVYKDGGMNFVHNVDSAGSCDDVSTVAEPKYYCIEGAGAMGVGHPIYLTTESDGTFQFSLLDMIKDMIGNMSDDITESNLDIISTKDFQAIFNAGLTAELDLGESFLSGFMPEGIPPTDMSLTILLPQQPAWVAGDNGSDTIVLTDRFSGNDSTRIKLQGSNLWNWSHPITEGGKELCTMYQKTCTSLVIDFNMEDFSINEWSQTVTLTVAASLDFKFYRVEVPPIISDALTSDVASISFDVIPADMIHLIVDMGDRMEDPFSKSIDIGNETYDLEFSRAGIESFGDNLGTMATDMLIGLEDKSTDVELDLSAMEVIVDIGKIPIPNPNAVSDLTPVSLSVEIPKTTFTLAIDMDTKTASVTTHSAVQATLANTVNRMFNAFSVHAGDGGIVFDNGDKNFETSVDNPGLELEELNTTPTLTLDFKLPKGLEFNEFSSSSGNDELTMTEGGQQRLVYTFPKAGESDQVSFSFKISWMFILGEIWAYLAIPILLIGLLIYKRRQRKKKKRAMKDRLIAKEYSQPLFEKDVPQFDLDDGFNAEGHYDVTPDWGDKKTPEAPPPPPVKENIPPALPSTPTGGRGKSTDEILGWE